jgi:hypothetical protein
MVESKVPAEERTRIRQLGAAWRATWSDRHADTPLSTLLHRLQPDLDEAFALQGVEGSAEHDGKDFDAIRVQVALPVAPAQITRPLEILQSLTWSIDMIERAMEDLVRECRRRDYSWAEIAVALGVARQSAWAKYASLDDAG